MTEVIRTCVVCGRKKPKEGLHRYVWGGNQPEQDEKGCAPGRGAYSCRSETCAEKLVTQKKKWKRVFRL